MEAEVLARTIPMLRVVGQTSTNPSLQRLALPSSKTTRAVAQRAAAKLFRNSEAAYAVWVRRPKQSSGEQAARMRRCICDRECEWKRDAAIQRLRHCERSEAIQSAAAERFWIASLRSQRRC